MASSLDRPILMFLVRLTYHTQQRVSRRRCRFGIQITFLELYSTVSPLDADAAIVCVPRKNWPAPHGRLCSKGLGLVMMPLQTILLRAIFVRRGIWCKLTPDAHAAWFCGPAKEANAVETTSEPTWILINGFWTAKRYNLRLQDSGWCWGMTLCRISCVR